MSDKHIFYIIGDDPTSRINEMSNTVEELVGNEDRDLCVESFDLSDAEDEESRIKLIEDAVNSLLSPPFLTSLRVVIIRDIGAGSSEEVASLISYVQNPSPTSRLIAVQGGGRISTLLTKAWKSQVTQIGNTRENTLDAFSRLSNEKSLSFEPGVKEILLKHCGESISKLTDIFHRLSSVYGENSKLTADDVSVYLGESGNVAYYLLANEICEANTGKSLEIVSRMLHSTSAEQAKPMHPLQIISMLANHFRKLAIVDDQSIKNQNDAFIALGSKGNPYAAKKSWELAKRLGSVRIMSAIELISTLDTAIKGGNSLDAQITLELGIVSLCQICDRSNEGEEKAIVEQFSTNLYV